MKSKKNTIKCSVIRCPNCSFQQQTFERDFIICNNQDCKKQIDVKKNLIKLVNGGEGGLRIFETNGE